MANIREISGNTIGSNAIIVQGDLNTTGAGTDALDEDDIHPEKITFFLEKICLTDPFYDKKRILELKGPFLHESFSWILDHEGFEKWRYTNKSGVLWVKGDPGKGKTMLLCGIIDELEKNPGINANLGYFLCQATDSRINTATSVVAGLISFFIKRIRNFLLQSRQECDDELSQYKGAPHICKENERSRQECSEKSRPHQRALRQRQEVLDICKEYEKKIKQKYDTKMEEPQRLLSSVYGKYEGKLGHLNGPNGWNILCDIFEEMTQNPALSDPVCIVDALDECEHSCKSLLSLIVKTSSHVKWLLSSRNVKDIEREFRAIEPRRRLSLELKENAENVSRSVDVYISNSITDIEALEDDKELQIKTTKILKDKANGTFLWVALVIEELRQTDHRNVEDVLEEIPEGLENLYDLIIRRAYSRVRQKDQEACRILLSIVTTAERPLHLEEVHVFIRSQWKHCRSTYNIRDMKDIIKDIGSLLSIRKDTVYFIHQSVKDYMVGKAARSIFPLGIEYQHYEMVKTSLDAMTDTLKYNIYDLPHPRSHVGNFTSPYSDPLGPIAYCCIFWVDHLVHVCESGGSTADEIFKTDGDLHSFLRVKYLCWVESLALLGSLTPKGTNAIQKLKNLAIIYYGSKANGHQDGKVTNIQRKGETNCLMQFISDAYHFFHSCKDYVKDMPLQLYYSAVVFEDEYSAICKTYRQPIQAHFGDYLTLLKKAPKTVLTPTKH